MIAEALDYTDAKSLRAECYRGERRGLRNWSVRRYRAGTNDANAARGRAAPARADLAEH